MPTHRLAQLALSIALLALVFFSVLGTASLAEFGMAASQLAAGPVAIVVACLALGVLLSSLRLKLIAADLGHTISLRDSTAALSVGQLVGNLFFQFAGQLIGRGAVLARCGIAPSDGIVISGYERLFALIASLTLAAGGAIYLFGRITLDMTSGGLTLVKLCIGAFVVVTAGALCAWGQLIRPLIGRITLPVFLHMLRNAAISFAVQLTTLAAYVVAGHSLAPQIDLVSLAAASTVVMFAASLPISLGGWGMREMSAVVALQTVGLPSASALLIALLIGIVSLVVAGVIALLVMIPAAAHRRASTHGPAANLSVDLTMTLEWALPLAAATAVLFQVFLPVGQGALNVNLADPLVMIGAALFALRQLRTGWPQWRVAQFNIALAMASAVIVLAFLHGLYAFGFTDWAFANRLLGWPVLLCYLLTGGLIVQRAGENGLGMLLATFAASAAAIVALEICILALAGLGLVSPLGLIEYRITGFSQNANAFAFILAIAFAAALPLEGRLPARTVIMALLIVGLYYAASRASFIAAPIVVAVAVATGIRPRPVMMAIGTAVALVVVVAVLPVAAKFLQFASSGPPGIPSPIPSPIMYGTTSDMTHLRSMIDGLSMFAAHPLFGSGLGAYMAEQLRATGTPLVIHSTAIWLLAETGLAGFLVFFFWAWRTYSTAFANRKTLWGLTLVLVLTVFAVISQAHDMLYQRAFWLMLGALLIVPLDARALHNSGPERPRPTL